MKLAQKESQLGGQGIQGITFCICITFLPSFVRSFVRSLAVFALGLPLNRSKYSYFFVF